MSRTRTVSTWSKPRLILTWLLLWAVGIFFLWSGATDEGNGYRVFGIFAGVLFLLGAAATTYALPTLLRAIGSTPASGATSSGD